MANIFDDIEKYNIFHENEFIIKPVTTQVADKEEVAHIEVDEAPASAEAEDTTVATIEEVNENDS